MFNLCLRAMHWHSDYDACLHIINKKTGEPHPMSKKIFTQGHICFHYPNAYEENGHIVIDATASWKQSNKDYTVGMRILIVQLIRLKTRSA